LLFGRLPLLLLAVARPDGLACAGAWPDESAGARPDVSAGADRANGALSEMQDTQMSAPPPVKVNW
jgi:hypothetical protein